MKTATEYFEDLLAENKSLKKDNDFLQRVLVQAILTNKGKLPVDNIHAEAAFAFNGKLEFGNGVITIYGSEFSLFPKQVKG